MSTPEILNFVRDFAEKSHGKQVRKYTGEKYIGHPVRVMEMVAGYHTEAEVLAAALLHDVLEDTSVSEQQMEQALLTVMTPENAKAVLGLVIELTDIFIKKNYPGLSRRVRKEKEAARLSHVSPEAQSIKYADIIDNVTDIVSQDSHFANTFVREAKRMLTVMTKGHPNLRDTAIMTVDKCLLQLKKPAESL